ncbi:MAG: class I SAM-dependent methyltransferase [Candidatus Hodarchaeota archaeon]
MTTKHTILTEEEFSKYSPNKEIIQYLDDYQKKNNMKKNDINVLDWGCGKGRDVLWLREQGYNAFGVDLDPEPIRNGRHLIRKKGYDDSILRLIKVDGKTNFPDDFFHFAFSNHVFEHINDLDSVVAELKRITVRNGIEYHLYPGYKSIREGHLNMPFIHWFPKNRIRKFLIFAFLCCGREPKWKELENYNKREKTEIYFKYSINNTFYRKYSKVMRIFEKNNFSVKFKMAIHPKWKKKILFKVISPFIHHLLLTFNENKLYATKLYK